MLFPGRTPDLRSSHHTSPKMAETALYRPDNALPLGFFEPFLLQKSAQKNAQRTVVALGWVETVVVARAMAVAVAVVVVVAAMTVA
jgi:hypothetical protein